MAKNYREENSFDRKQGRENTSQDAEGGAEGFGASLPDPKEGEHPATFFVPAVPLKDTEEAFAGAHVVPTGVDADALADMQTYSSLQEKRKKAKRKKGITIAIVCLVAAVVVIGGIVGLIGSMTGDVEGDTALQTVFVERGLFLDEVSASGKLKPVSSVIATPEVEGIVGEVYVSEGDAVTAGQVLYTVINDELDKAISQAQQGINDAYNGVAQAQIAVDDAYRAKQQGLDAAAAASATGAEDMGMGTTFDVGQADSAIKQAELALSSAWSGYNNAQVAYDEAVARAAKRSVTSPINGSVVAVNIEPGKSLISSGGSAATTPVQIADLSRMLVSVEVNEVDILKIAAGQTASLTFSAIPDLELTGVVNRIATVNTGASTDMGMGASGTVTYAVDILIENPDARLKPGMTTKASIESERIEDVLMVPLSAVTMLSATEGSVLVVDPDAETPESFTEHTVEVLASNGLTVAVKGSISEGDELLIIGDAGMFGSDATDSAGSSAGVTVMSVG